MDGPLIFGIMGLQAMNMKDFTVKDGWRMSQLIIRNATMEDLDTVVAIEAACFPAAEAADQASMEERLAGYAKGFFIGEVDGVAVGFINGACSDSPVIEDKFYESMKWHTDDGINLMVYGLDVMPDHRGRGYARRLMEAFIAFAKAEGKAAVLLTCKSHLVNFYESFGYVNQGLSDSTHGGAEWYDLQLDL
jgi:GNAT superfamily N-acetyltransferase